MLFCEDERTIIGIILPILLTKRGTPGGSPLGFIGVDTQHATPVETLRVFARGLRGEMGLCFREGKAASDTDAQRKGRHLVTHTASKTPKKRPLEPALTPVSVSLFKT